MPPRINTVFITGENDKEPVLAVKKPTRGNFKIHVHIQYIYFTLDVFSVRISVQDQNNKIILAPTDQSFDFRGVDTQNSNSGISEVSFFVIINADEVKESNNLTASVKIGDEERDVTVFLTSEATDNGNN